MTTEQKLDRVLEQLSNHSVVLAEHTILHKQNTEDLREHIKRTNLLEEKLLALYKWMWTLVGAGAVLIYIINHVISLIK